MISQLSLKDMMARLIGAPSISSFDPALDMGNRAVIDMLAEWLEGMGYQIEIQELPNHSNKANLIATLGTGDNGLVLAGHTDTVPYDEHGWQSDPFRLTEADGRYYGLGTSDMKSFLALAIDAARGLQSADLQRPLTLLATADEESTMDGAKLLGTRGKPLGRYCVIGEPTNMKPVRQHKGIFMEAIRLQGQSGHSSDPSLGNNALEGMQLVIEELLAYRTQMQARYCNEAFVIPVPTLNLGHIHGGDNPNRICADCELHYDLRPLPGMDIADLRNEIRERVSMVTRQRGLLCEFKSLFEGIPAMETAADSKIVTLTESLSGHGSETVAFGTEGPYLNEMGTETVIMGPGDIAQAHQPDEYLALDRIQPTVDLLKSLIKNICVDNKT